MDMITILQWVGILLLVLPVTAAVLYLAFLIFILVFKVAFLLVCAAALFAFIYFAQGGTF